MFKTFKAKALFTLFSFFLIGGISVYWLISTDYVKLSTQNAKSSLTMLSQSVFQTLRQGMNFGSQEVIRQIEEDAKQIDGIKQLKVHKSQQVIEFFNLKSALSDDPEVQETFRSKREKLLETQSGNQHSVRLLKPLIAEQECLSCHANAQPGDVLGVMDLTISMNAVDKKIHSSKLQLLLIMAVAVAIGLAGLVIFFSKELVQPLNKLTSMARELSGGEGDLTKRLEIKNEDEVSTASKYINTFIQKIQNTVTQAKDSSDENIDMGSQLQRLSKDLVESAKTQTRYVEDVDTIANEIDSNLQTNREYSDMTTADLKSTEQSLENLSAKLTSVIQSIQYNSETQEDLSQRMGSLNEQADQINNVLEIISDIADQTGLLALNAAIEAARAGEHGRGFSVVADEVRKLAEKTQQSLTEIKATTNIIVQNITSVSDEIKQASNDVIEVSRSANNLIEQTDQTRSQLQNTISTEADSSQKLLESIEKTADLLQMMDQIVQISSKTEKSGMAVHKMSESLLDKANFLQSELGQFKV